MKRFNALLCEEDYFFEILIANHQGKNSELYHVDVSDNPEKVRPYKAIGSGAETADKFCAGLSFDTITMKDFTKRAFLATAYMDQHHPELRVGIGSGGIPLIKHMNYNQEWDKEITDLEECRNYANERIKKLKDCFEAILKE